MTKISAIELRHKLHQNPETAYNEFETTELIKNSVKKIANKKVKIHTPYKTGLLVEYKANEDKEYLLFRADIDALKIKEQTNSDFQSKNDNMHACGHDVHSSILYGFIKDIIENDFNNNLLFLFQPAEESGGGAMQFYNTGIFKEFDIKNAFSLHVTDEYNEGVVASTSGVLFASAMELDIEFLGESAHVAFPHQGKNAFNALRIFMDEIDKLKKEVDEPFVFAPGVIKSGEVRNIAPGFAKIECTMRALSSEKALDFYNRIEKKLNELKDKTGVDYNLISGAHYPEVIVNKDLYSKLKPAIEENFDFIDCGHKMTGEDFGYFSQKYPSFMFWLGTSKGEKYGLHNPKFLPDDTVIQKGIEVFNTIINKLK